MNKTLWQAQEATKNCLYATECVVFPSCAALKKPAITQKHDDAPDALVGGGAGPGVGAGDGPAAQGLDQPRLQQDRVEARPAMIAPPGIVRQAEKAVVFEEDNKVGIKADELGEQQRQLGGTECFASPWWVLILIIIFEACHNSFSDVKFCFLLDFICKFP